MLGTQYFITHGQVGIRYLLYKLSSNLSNNGFNTMAENELA